MVSAQRPNQYQLSIAQQFVEHFPYVTKTKIVLILIYLNNRLLNVLVFIFNLIQ